MLLRAGVVPSVVARALRPYLDKAERRLRALEDGDAALARLLEARHARRSCGMMTSILMSILILILYENL